LSPIASRGADLHGRVDQFLGSTPRRCVAAGDIAQDATPADYAAARGALSQLACPVYATIGNRDRRGPFHDAFATDGYLEPRSGFVQFAVNLGSLRIVAVDTTDPDSYLGAFCPERELDLRRLLNACPRKQCLVFLHHPPVALPGFSLQFRDPERAAALVHCVDQCPGCLACLLVMSIEPLPSRLRL
jgi:Icc protein